jgi:hypothetical protein
MKSSRLSRLVFALLVSGVAVGLQTALAAELTADTNTIESLTPEQATTLVTGFPGVTLEVEIAGFGKVTAARCLPLNGLPVVAAETAEALARYRKGPLFLDGLTTLSDEAARALAQHKGGLLSLNGLATLPDDAAQALTQHKGYLFLNGLTTLSDQAAKALAPHKGGLLSLNGLATLPDDAAQALTQHKGYLFLNGLTTLSDQAAKALAPHRGNELFLNRLTTLNSVALVTKLTQGNDALLWISRLTAVSPEVAKVLAAVDKWDGRLPSLTTLDSPDSVEIAKALATRKQRLSLPNLEKISPKTLSALLEKRDVEIPLVETLELLPEPDGSLTEDFIIPEWLEARERQQRAAQATE